MAKLLRSLVLGLAAGSLLTSCAAGPHQLRRSVDDFDHKLYVNSPWIDAVLWIVPAFELGMFVAFVGDFFVTDAYAFWLNDAWDGKGTGYEHLTVEPKDVRMQSLLTDGSGWLRTK